MSAANEANLIAIVGATGSGKSLRVKRLLESKRPRRVVIWDWKGEYAGDSTSSPGELAKQLAKAGKGGACVIGYRPRKESAAVIERQFDIVCNLANAWGNCWFIAEELANVTTASRAPDGWRRLCTEGRHSALTVIGTTQSPALVDKTFFTNATDIYCGMLRAGSHKKYMSDCLDVPLDELRILEPLQWVYRGRTGAAKRDDLAGFERGRKRKA